MVGGCLWSVSAVRVLVCLCFGGCMMGSLFAMSVAALLVVGAQFWYILLFDNNNSKSNSILMMMLFLVSSQAFQITFGAEPL